MITGKGICRKKIEVFEASLTQGFIRIPGVYKQTVNTICLI